MRVAPHAIIFQVDAWKYRNDIRARRFEFLRVFVLISMLEIVGDTLQRHWHIQTRTASTMESFGVVVIAHHD
jgi:hypothetical protein